MPPWSPTAQDRTSNSSGGTSRTSGRQPKWDSRYPCSEFERPVIGAPPLLQTASVPWHADGLDSAYDRLGFGRKHGLYLPFPYIRLGKHIYKVRSCRANTVHPMAELNPALLLIRIGGESGEPGVLDGPTHRKMVEVLVGEVLEAKDTMHGVVEVTPDTSTPNPGSFGF